MSKSDKKENLKELVIKEKSGNPLIWPKCKALNQRPSLLNIIYVFSSIFYRNKI